MGWYIGERNTTTNPTTGDPTIITKGQQPEIAETCGYLKRHQGKSREERRHIPIYRGNTYGLIGKINHSGTLGKI